MHDFSHRRATDNWAKISYDKDVWIPMPISFEGTGYIDELFWASDMSREAIYRSGKTKTPHNHYTFEHVLLRYYKAYVRKVPAHKLYLHCPDFRYEPVAVCVGLWKCLGTRDEAFGFYSRWGTESAVEEPVSTPVRTGYLGDGLRTEWTGKPHVLHKTHGVNYVFRNEEFNTDVHVFVREDDKKRFERVMLDLDEFVAEIHCTPDPGNGGVVVGPDGPFTPAG